MNSLLLISLLLVLPFAFGGVTVELTEQDETKSSITTFKESPPSCTNTMPAGTHTVEIDVGSKKRSFDIYVPAGLSNGEVRPVVFFWHGYGGSPEKIVDFAKPNEMADRMKYFVVYPKGSGIIAGFNGAGCCPLVFADDIAFFRAMADWMGKNMCGDTDNIYSAGFSNGGFMTNRLACEVSDVIKGIAVHSGSIGKKFVCEPTKGIPALLIHGDADPTVPYFGNGQWKSFAEVSEEWATLNQCGSEENAKPGYRSQKTECVRYDTCARDNVPLEFCTVQGLGHAWSGSGDYQIDATAYIFQFFESLITKNKKLNTQQEQKSILQSPALPSEL